MKKSTTKTTIIVICLIFGLVAYYSYLTNRARAGREEAKMSTVESVLSRDLVNDYPSTPKEVLKYYNEIMKCFYNEDCTEEEIEELGYKARELYDAELLEENEPEAYMIRLKADIQDYQDNKRRIASSSVAASTSVVYDTVDGYSFARILCGYSVMEGSTNHSVKAMYLLRRDEEKKWKIYGWQSQENLQKEQEQPGFN